VHDLLARVAFLLERSNPHHDTISWPALDSQPDPATVTAPRAVTVERPMARIDHDALAVQLGVVIAAVEDLTAWKAELERTAGGNDMPPVMEVAGLDNVRHRLSLRATSIPSMRARA
jgi:hypothetical protein